MTTQEQPGPQLNGLTGPSDHLIAEKTGSITGINIINL